MRGEPARERVASRGTPAFPTGRGHPSQIPRNPMRKRTRTPKKPKPSLTDLSPPYTPTVDHSGQGDYYSGVPPPEEEGSLWSWLTGEDDEPRRGESANFNNEDEDTFTVRFFSSYLRTGN